MDKNKVTREGFRHILLGETDSLNVTFPASPCPYPSGPAAVGSEISYRGDTTPVGGVSVTEARLQRVLNRAAYEENVRRAAGSALTYGTQEEECEPYWEQEGQVAGKGAVETIGTESCFVACLNTRRVGQGK